MRRLWVRRQPSCFPPFFPDMSMLPSIHIKKKEVVYKIRNYDAIYIQTINYLSGVIDIVQFKNIFVSDVQPWHSAACIWMAFKWVASVSSLFFSFLFITHSTPLNVMRSILCAHIRWCCGGAKNAKRLTWRAAFSQLKEKLRDSYSSLSLSISPFPSFSLLWTLPEAGAGGFVIELLKMRCRPLIHDRENSVE